MTVKAGGRAALRPRRRPTRAFMAVLALTAASLLSLWVLWPSLPAQSFAREQQVRGATSVSEGLGRVAALSRKGQGGGLAYDSCVPLAVNISISPAFPQGTDASLGALYKALSEAASDLPPPPELRGDHRRLCNPAYHESSMWSYCLPIRSIRRDARCVNSSGWNWRKLVALAASGQVMGPGSSADGDVDDEGYGDVDGDDGEFDDQEEEEEMESFRSRSEEVDDEEEAYRRDDGDVVSSSTASQELPGVDSPCVYASVLHLLLVEVFGALRAEGLQPALVFGSLLGAVRNEAVIPFTKDVDIGFRKNLKKKLVMRKVKDALIARGYHMFKDSLYRVCVAPTHPLAGFLYDRSVSRRRKYHVPYADLYPMTPEDGETRWKIDRARNDSYRVESRAFEPYATVKVGGAEFAALADSHAFLRQEYGPDFLIPRPIA